MSYKLDRQDTGKISDDKSEIRCFLIVRNGMLRLPYFLEYHRRIGVSRFFIVDNDSDDNTKEYLLAQKNVHLWHTTAEFRGKNSGKKQWTDELLREYGEDQWCLLLDVDELFFHPHTEMTSIQKLTNYLEEKRHNAFRTTLLDMYSNEIISDMQYKKGQDFLEYCPYFIYSKVKGKMRKVLNPFRLHCMRKHFPLSQIFKYVEGTQSIRSTCFNLQVCTQKFPLIFYRNGMSVNSGRHVVSGVPISIAKTTGVLLHFKFLQDFPEYVESALVRKSHWKGSREYIPFQEKLSQDPHLSLSIKGANKFEGTEQLESIGAIDIENQYTHHMQR